MNSLRRILALGLFCGPLFVGRAEAMVVKCQTRPGDTPIRTTTPLLVVDGEVMVDPPAPAGVSSATGTATSAIRSFKPEDMLVVRAACLDVIEAGVKVRRPVLFLITKAGAMAFMRRSYYGIVGLTGYRDGQGNDGPTLVKGR